MSDAIPPAGLRTTVPNSAQDGITHINVWTKGRTRLGRLLSNLTQIPIRHPVHGWFASMEAYWFWCGSGRTQDHLRRKHGTSARSAGMKCDQVPMEQDEFRDMIREGLSCKVYQAPDIIKLLVDTTLPLLHYYDYGRSVVDKYERHGWQMDWLQLIRLHLQERLFVMNPPAALPEGMTQIIEYADSKVDILWPDTRVRAVDGRWIRASEIEWDLIAVKPASAARAPLTALVADTEEEISVADIPF